MTAPALTTALATSLALAPASEMAGFGMAASDLSYFADFEEVKKINKKTPLGETGCLCIFSWPWPHVTGTPPWLLRPVKVSTSSELYPDTWLFF